MTMTRAKSKKAVPDICSEISNKILTRGALFVVEATRQNVLEAFSLLGNRNKLPLVAIKATFLSLAGFSLVKVPLKRHTWMSQDLPLAVLPNVVSSDRSSLVLEAKQSLSVGLSVLKNWTNQMETESSSLLKTITSCQKFAGWVASTLVPSATFKIKLGHIKAVFQLVYGFLGAKSVSKNNIKLFCVEFASQMFLETAFLVEFTSFVHLATLKIAKFLVISEFGSPSATVVLHDVPLGVSTANIKMALSVFGSVTHVVLKPVGIWQYVVVYFEKLDSAVSALNHWSVLVDKDSVRILPLVNQNETILSHDKFKAKLVNLSSICTAFEISDMIFQFALVTFGFQADLDSAVVKTKTPGYCHCFKCQELGHLAAEYKISLSPPLKSSKVFTPHFVGSVSYTKAFASLSSSEFPPLSPLVSSLVVVGNFTLFALVEFIVKPIGSLVKLFEQFINSNLVSSSKLGFKINEIIVHMGSFSKIVSKLEREVVSLKKECCIEDIDMSGNLKHPVGLNDKVFSNLMFLWEHEPVDVKSDGLKTAKWLVRLVPCSVTLFFVVQKILALDKFSSRASM
ncbi:hypothetical protein G9A89_021944 [Geosiphon pyriformis]|nr:hypothetical protein G9A89_021944 [Geosiphon pyriformis]